MHWMPMSFLDRFFRLTKSLVRPFLKVLVRAKYNRTALTGQRILADPWPLPSTVRAFSLNNLGGFDALWFFARKSIAAVNSTHLLVYSKRKWSVSMERAWISDTLAAVPHATGNTVLNVRNFSSTSFSGSNGGLERAPSTTLRSHAGILGRGTGALKAPNQVVDDPVLRVVHA